jgi:hypothetical protein
MDSMSIALILSQPTTGLAQSALPNAPVVPHVERVAVAPRTRKTIAGALRQLADVVAPPAVA